MYEPKGKTLVLFDAMRAAPGQPIWTQDDCALVMGLPRSMVPPYLKTALEKGAMYRRLNDRNQPEFSLKPFPVVAPAEDPRVPKFGEPWTPPKMTAPRPGSDVPVPSRAPGVPPAAVGAPAAEPEKMCAGCTRPICWDKGCVAGRVVGVIVPAVPIPASASSPTPSPAPTPAPTAMPTLASTPSPAAEPEIPRFLSEARREAPATGSEVRRDWDRPGYDSDPTHFDLEISLRTGGAKLTVPGHGTVHLTCEQREQLAEWLAPTEAA